MECSNCVDKQSPLLLFGATEKILCLDETKIKLWAWVSRVWLILSIRNLKKKLRKTTSTQTGIRKGISALCTHEFTYLRTPLFALSEILVCVFNGKILRTRFSLLSKDLAQKKEISMKQIVLAFLSFKSLLCIRIKVVQVKIINCRN